MTTHVIGGVIGVANYFKTQLDRTVRWLIDSAKRPQMEAFA